MTQFKKGDKFIPRKPKANTTILAWPPEMDIYDGATLEVSDINVGYLKARESIWLFHPDWCEKVEEESVNFVQREGTEIISECIMSTNASANITFIQPEFPLEQALETTRTPSIRVPKVNKTVDWEQRRYELAKAAVQGLMYTGCWNVYELPKLVEKSIEIADEMIKQLKIKEDE